MIYLIPKPDSAQVGLSRIDTCVDGMLDKIGTTTEARALRGTAAVACARLAYREYRQLLASPVWRRLAGQGARPQRLLWASTSTKDPACSDVKYVEPLIGADTVTTMPPETLAAYRDHGDPALRLEQELEAACTLPARLAALGIELETVSEELERQGVQKFSDAYERVLAALARSAGELAA